MSGDAAAAAQKDRIRRLLDVAEGRSAPIRFWWRDDDARTATAELVRLVHLVQSHDLPLGLAVIPDGATEDLAVRVADAPRVAVLQHGWSHARHNPPGEKKSELGDHRAADVVLRELRTGKAILTGLFPQSFLPVLVPPWNRIGKAAAERRTEAGLPGLSVFGRKRSADPYVVNTHLDLIDWQTRGSIGPARAYALLCDEVERRLENDGEPVGILSHHLAQGGETWALLEDLLDLLAPHPGVRWPRIGELFGLEADRPSGFLKPPPRSASPP